MFLFSLCYFLFFDVEAVFFPLFAVVDLVVLALFFVCDAGVLDLPEAFDLAAAGFFGASFFSMPEASIAEAAAPTTAPLAAPEATSPSTSFVLA
jgi:hypothetical protein